MRNILIISLFALAFFSCRNSAPTTRTAGYAQVIDLSAISQVRHDSVGFGRMKEGEKVEYKLGLRNADTTAMVILEIMNGCGCTTLEYDRRPILPGDTAALTLLYDSKGQAGIQRKLLQVITNLSEKPRNIFMYAEVNP